MSSLCTLAKEFEGRGMSSLCTLAKEFEGRGMSSLCTLAKEFEGRGMSSLCTLAKEFEGRGMSSLCTLAKEFEGRGMSSLCTLAKEFEGRGKKTLTLPEVDAILTKYDFAPESSDNLREAFRIFDKEGAGMIDTKELRNILTNLGEKLTEDEVDEMIREADITGQGQVNYNDFVRVMENGL
ncbi:hypothetical protein ACOMHN_003833 [Nucella lapillus]